jgi:hypothetical protein
MKENKKSKRLGLKLDTKWEISLLIAWMILTTAIIFSFPFPYDILVVIYAFVSMILIQTASERAYKEKLKGKRKPFNESSLQER